MSKTKMTFEVEIEASDPIGAVNLVKNSLNWPSVSSLVLVEISSNYKPIIATDLNLRCLTELPRKLI